MKHEDREAALITLHAVCAHTGDVLENAKQYLKDHRYHLTTSEKKLLVRLLESYPANNLRINLMQSLHLRERNLKVLQHLDYSRFSRSEAHLEAVRALRNGELLSWHGVGEALLSKHSPEALMHFAQRPGYMVRMLSRLLSLDYSEADILRALEPRSGAISGHLVLKTLRTMLKRGAELDTKYRQAVEACNQKYWFEEHTSTDDQRERSFIDLQAESRRQTARFICLEQPEQTVREEVFRTVSALEKKLSEKRKALLNKRELITRLKQAADRRRRDGMYRNASHDIDVDLLHYRLYADMPEKLQQQFNALAAEIDLLKEQIEAAQAEAQEQLDRRIAEARAENAVRYAQTMGEIDAWTQEELARLERRIAKEAEGRITLPERRAAELEALDEQYRREKLAARYDAQAASILKHLLRAHFAQADTPLKGKKVFLDMKEFDLEHSVLETEDRSKDGGYIRSGIAYKIPEGARYVRFFTYWNDRQRIDIDLHAGGVTTDGRELHVGWNAAFRGSGVVHSGDITHSDAAEYIDIDLSAPIREIYTNVHFFNGRSFKHIETCYVGMMAVDQIGQTISRYDPANCFFTHKLTQNTNSLYYGFIDVQNRFVRFVGQMNESRWAARPPVESEETMFSLREYLDTVIDGQGAELVASRQEADVVLTMGKSLLDNGMSLADNNFFLEC